jgi:hypothetical protein
MSTFDDRSKIFKVEVSFAVPYGGMYAKDILGLEKLEYGNELWRSMDMSVHAQ